MVRPGAMARRLRLDGGDGSGSHPIVGRSWSRAISRLVAGPAEAASLAPGVVRALPAPPAGAAGRPDASDPAGGRGDAARAARAGTKTATSEPATAGAPGQVPAPAPQPAVPGGRGSVAASDQRLGRPLRPGDAAGAAPGRGTGQGPALRRRAGDGTAVASGASEDPFHAGHGQLPRAGDHRRAGPGIQRRHDPRRWTVAGPVTASLQRLASFDRSFPDRGPLHVTHPDGLAPGPGAARIRWHGSSEPAGDTARGLLPATGAGAATGRQGPSSASTRFAAVMRSRGQDRPEALPAHLEPLARVIAGRAPVSMSTGPNSRAALAAAGKRAATVGRVIHLEGAPDRSARTSEIMAHELVHVARPSAVPRFFGDDHRDAEERHATRTGQLLRALGGHAPADLRGAGVERLAVAAPALPFPAPSTTAAPPRPLVPERRDRRGGDTSTLQRAFFDAAGSPAVSRLVTDPPATTSPSHGAPSVSYQSEPSLPHQGPTAWELTPETLEQIIEAVEERIIEDLERRGLRHNPGVF